jgi:sulfatase maturation enzyme AslB (radical SAM superfamily)
MAIDSTRTAAIADDQATEHLIDLMLNVMSDGLDHPELWILLPPLVTENPLIPAALYARLANEPRSQVRVMMKLLLGLSLIATDGPSAALETLMPFSALHSMNIQVQGTIFYLEGLLDPKNPKFQLAGKVCLKPFIELDVLDGSTHLCCASWLPISAGNLSLNDWQDIWNGDVAQAVRASMTDGSYRFCNKRTCPTIQTSQFLTINELEIDPRWGEIMKTRETVMPRGPELLNLAYDRTCNLSCPSCRTTRYAADDTTRARLDVLQEEKILPLLDNAKTVFVTGSGDPFASKNFRRLMEQLNAEKYPDLKFIIMTNGMLLTPKQWAAFPSLHNRVESLRISLDAATGSTHERLRRGARWPVMEENLKFAGQLLADKLIEDFMITFTVQAENYREMGDAVSLAREIGASQVYFGRLTNWGTFSAAEYDQKAVFVPGHPEYEDFLVACRDLRLRDPMVAPTDLDEFIHATH